MPVSHTPRILCYGDSNTYGYDPAEIFERRYPPQQRWPEILAAASGWDVVNLGLNGRMIPYAKREVETALAQIQRQLPADCLVVMLGSNDVFRLDCPPPELLAERMKSFLLAVRESMPSLPLLLIAPPRIAIPLAHYQELFWRLAPAYEALAQELGIFFAAAPQWELPLSADGVHFSAQAHERFAAEIERCLRQALSL